MKLTRRFLALLLAFSMSLSMVTPAFASEVETVAETEAVVEEIAAVEAEAVNETAAGTTEASTEGSDETTEVSDETTEGSDETTEGSGETTEAVEPEAGSSEENPVQLYVNMFADGTYTVTVPAGATYYYALYNAGGMLLSIDGGEAVEMTGNMMYPDTFEITNDGDEAAEYVLTLTAPVGDQSNPEIIWDPSVATVSLEEGDDDGYYLSFCNRAAVGTLVFTPSCEDEGVEYDVVLTNMTTYDMAWLSDSEDGTVSIAINPGDFVNIQVSAMPDENWVYPAAEIALNGEIVYPVGSSENPEIIWTPDFEATLEEGDQDGYYYSLYNRAAVGTMVLTPSCDDETVEYDVILTNMTTLAMAWLSDSVDGTVSIEVNPNDYITIQVVTVPDENWVYPAAKITVTGEVVAPVGSFANPELLWDPSTAVATLAEGNSEGYYYSYYNRAVVGTLVLTPTCATEGVEYDVVLTNMTTYDMAWLSDSTDGTVGIAINPGDYVTIQVVTLPDANWVYPAAEIALNGAIVYPVGSSENPEVIWDVADVVASIEEGNSNGYYYSFYNRAATAELVLAPTCATEGVEYDVILTNMSNYDMAWLSDSEDGTVSIAINPGDYVTIQVVTLPDENWVYPAAEIALNGEIVFPVGSSENPEIIWDPSAAVATLAEGDSDGYYFTFYNRAATADLVLAPTCATEGVEYDVILTNMSTYDMAWLSDSTDGTVSIAINPGDSVTIQVVTLPDENWVYPAAEIALNGAIVYPLGSSENPEVIWDPASVNAVIAEGDFDGYYYSMYNRAVTGSLVFAPVCTTEGVEYDVILTNMTTYEMAWLSDSTDGTVAIDINPGDMITVQVVTLPDENWVYPAAEIALNGYIVYPLGSEMNPDTLSVYVENDYNEENAGQNIATVEANNYAGYMYTWIADADGELTITMSNGKAGWSFSLSNLTAGIYRDSHYSCDVPAVASETIAVKAGDEIRLVVNSCGAEPYGKTPAGEVYFNASFVKTVGIESNPYLPEWNWNDAETEATAVVTVPAGVESYWIGMTNRAPMMLSINGGEAEQVTGGYPPVLLELTGNAAEDTVYELYIYFPEGTMSNPAVIEEGTYTAELAEGSEGAYYTFIAPDRGEVTITINGASITTMDEEGNEVVTELGWQYFVNNLTNWSYGENHWSNDETVVASETLSVNKGDELMIFVTTYDPNSWAAPAGTVSFDVSFEAALGTENNPNWIYDASFWQWTDVPANTSVYYSAYGIGGMDMFVNAKPGMSVEVNGEVYAADEYGVIYLTVPASANPRMPVSFAITNANDWDSEADFGFYYPIGSMSNPAEMVLGKKNTASVEAGNSQGYFFTWIATGNGYLEFTMNTKTGWTYAVNNLTSCIYGDTHWSDDSPVVNKEYIKVSKGDEIQIMVNTYDPASWANPAGTIQFTPKLIVSYTETLLAGKTTTLKYIDPATGKAVSASNVEWSMTMADGTEVPATVATLKAGKLTAAKTVTEPTEVIVTAAYGEAEYRYYVTIYPAATSVVILDAEGNDVTGKTLTMVVNDWQNWPELTAVVGPEGAMNEVTWKSSSEKVAGVNDGYVYPNATKGSVTITATAADGSGKKATVKVNVITEVTWIEVVSKTGFYSVGAGKALTMVADTNADATNKKVTWSIVEGADYATINASGKLTANKGLTEAHDVVVVATAQDGSGTVGSCAVTVLPVASKVEITGVPEGNTYDMNYWWPEFHLGAEVLDAEGNYISGDVTWKSSSDKIATIDEYGTVFCVKPGIVTFTATANDGSGKKATVKVTIVKSPSEVQLPSRAVVAAGKTLNLSNPIVLDADASNKTLTWAFDDPETAAALGVKVNNGKVTSNAKLITEPVELSLTATAVLGDAYGDHASATTIIMIYPATKSVSIMSSGAAVGKSLKLTSGDSIVLYAEGTPANCANRYSWTSSNESVATIEYNPDGSVTVNVQAMKTSKATITATAVDGTNKKASVTVNVVADVEALHVDNEVVLTGKSVNLNSNLYFLDWDPEYGYYYPITPASKTVTWSLSLADYSDGTGKPTFIPCENNECYAGTLDAKTGVFKAAKVTEAAYCFVTATYIDDDGNEIVSNGAQITVTPVALKGIDIIGCEGAWNEDAAVKITGKTVTTTTGRYVLNLSPTNPAGEYPNYMWMIDLSDWENFEIRMEEVPVEEYDEEGNLLYSYTQYYPAIVPVDDGDPYGTVKVTIIAEGGATKKASATIIFAEPAAE